MRARKEKEMEEEEKVDRRRRRSRINRRESDSGQPNASRHCPRLFASLSLPRGDCRYEAALFAYALNIAASRTLFEGSQHHSPLSLLSSLVSEEKTACAV